MKSFVGMLLFFCLISPCLAAAQGLTSSPEKVVDIQLETYNRGDIEAFVATFADDIKLYAHPNTLQMEGIEAVRKAYGGYFAEHPDLHAEVTHKIILGQYVIYQERVTGIVGGEDFTATAIYEVHEGKIRNI